jgi:hypothetical protein
MNWNDVNDALPEHGQAVLIRRADDNWHRDHMVDGIPHRVWRWQACQFVRGRTAAELAAMGAVRVVHPEDEDGNNLRPYYWNEFGPGSHFGQDVTHWVAITDPLVDDDDGKYGQGCI